MFKTRFFQILFSLAVIAALILAIAPAPAYALSSSNTSAVTSGSAVNQVNTTLPNSVLVCRIVVVRHDGHVTRVWRCRKVARPT